MGKTSGIGELARATCTKVETVRWYERIGLLAAPARTAGNYRAYGREHLERLSFVRRARDLGFSLDQVRELLRLSDQRGCGARIPLECFQRLKAHQRPALASNQGRSYRNKRNLPSDCELLSCTPHPR